MAFENGVNWKPLDPDRRGRHASFKSAVEAVFDELTAGRDAFYETVAGRWDELFPGLPARPVRSEGGVVYLAVKNAPTCFVVRPRLAAVRRRLSELPGAPKRLEVRLEVRA